MRGLVIRTQRRKRPKSNSNAAAISYSNSYYYYKKTTTKGRSHMRGLVVWRQSRKRPKTDSVKNRLRCCGMSYSYSYSRYDTTSTTATTTATTTTNTYTPSGCLRGIVIWRKSREGTKPNPLKRGLLRGGDLFPNPTHHYSHDTTELEGTTTSGCLHGLVVRG